MADDRNPVPRDETQAGAATWMRRWLPPAVADVLAALSLRRPRVARVLTYVAAAVLLTVLGVQYGMPILKDAIGILEPRARLSLRAEPAVPGRLLGTVENLTDRPIVVSGVSVKVLTATPAPFTLAGEMDIPVAQSFSMILAPTPGMQMRANAAFAMIQPKSVENIELLLGSEGPKNLPWTQYELEISVDAPQKSIVASTVALAVPTMRK